MNPLTRSQNPTLVPVLTALTLACCALAPQVGATCQDACLSNNNTVQGDDALISLTTGTDNTAVGFNALLNNTTGSSNAAYGYQALYSDTTGYNNTATGVYALYSNTEGLQNTTDGVLALYSNTTGNSNTATGASALVANATGNSNTAIGIQALFHNTTGGSNIALGFQAGARLTTGSANIYIGNTGRTGESNNIRIGITGTHTATYIAGISGATVPTGVAVIVDSSGHLGTTTSSARFKEAIKPMDKTSEAILALKPVTFRYKQELDPKGVPQFGLIAEEVAKVKPDLVVADDQGKPFTVRYEAVNAMLLNEFLKEHKAFLEEKRKVQELEANAAHQQKQIEALTAGLQRVSVHLAVSKRAPQVVLNNQ